MFRKIVLPLSMLMVSTIATISLSVIPGVMIAIEIHKATK